MQKKDLNILRIIFMVSTLLMIGSILFYFFYKPDTSLTNINPDGVNPSISNSASSAPISESAKSVLDKYGWSSEISYSPRTEKNEAGYNLILSNKKIGSVKISLFISETYGQLNVRNFAPNDKFVFYGKTVINLETGAAANIFTDYVYCDGKLFRWTPDNMLLTYGSSSSTGGTFACVFDPDSQKVLHHVGFDLKWGEDFLPIGDASYYDHNFYIYKITGGQDSDTCSIYKASSKVSDTPAEEKLKLSLYKTVSDSVRTSVGTNRYCKSTILDVNGTSFKLGRDFIPD